MQGQERWPSLFNWSTSSCIGVKQNVLLNYTRGGEVLILNIHFHYCAVSGKCLIKLWSWGGALKLNIHFFCCAVVASNAFQTYCPMEIFSNSIAERWLILYPSTTWAGWDSQFDLVCLHFLYLYSNVFKLYASSINSQFSPSESPWRVQVWNSPSRCPGGQLNQYWEELESSVPLVKAE